MAGLEERPKRTAMDEKQQEESKNADFWACNTWSEVKLAHASLSDCVYLFNKDPFCILLLLISLWAVVQGLGSALKFYKKTNLHEFLFNYNFLSSV